MVDPVVGGGEENACVRHLQTHDSCQGRLRSLRQKRMSALTAQCPRLELYGAQRRIFKGRH